MPYEVFISYARSDNAGVGDEAGWVTSFYERLVDRLGVITGRQVTVYFDSASHPPATPLSAIVRTEVKQAQVLVCVLTSAFTQRPWCRDEVFHFLQGRAAPAVLHAVKLPPSQAEKDQLAEQIRQIPPIDFWQPAGKRKYPIEFAGDSEEYRVAVNDLAHDIVSRLGTPGPGLGLRPVYLARTAPDLLPARLELERELMDEGHPVVPKDLLGDAAETVEGRITSALEDCTLAIHMIGREPGPVPANAPTVTLEEVQVSESLLAQQWRLSKAPKEGRNTVVWFPTGMAAEDVGQIALVNSIQNEPGTAAIVQGTIGDLKQQVRRLLEISPPPPSPVVSAARATERKLYLLRDLADDAEVTEVARQLRQHAHVMMLPKDGSQAELREIHSEFLKIAECALVFWGKASQAWVQIKLLELGKTKRLPNGRRGAFVRDKDDPPKRDFQFPADVNVLYTAADLDAFVAGGAA